MIEHADELFLAGRLFPFAVIQQSKAAVARSQADAPLDGNGFAVHILLVAVGSAVEEGNLNFGAPPAGGAFSPDQLLQVASTVRPAGIGAQADLDRRQYRRLARPVVALRTMWGCLFRREEKKFPQNEIKPAAHARVREKGRMATKQKSR